MNKLKKILVGILSAISFFTPLFVNAAIAYDTSNQSQSVVSATTSHSLTCSGTNNVIMLQVVLQDSAKTLSAITVDGNSATIIGSSQTGDDKQYMYYYKTATAATYSISATQSSSGSYIALTSACYSGVDQTSPINASSQGGPSTPATVVSTVDNAWGVMVAENTAGGVPGAGTGSTQRQVTFDSATFFDSNGPKTPAGTISMGMNTAGNYWTIAALNPSIGSVVTSPSQGIIFFE